MGERDLAWNVGRLIIGKIPGLVMDDASRRLLTGGIMSGVVLFKDNAHSIEQLLQLVADIHEATEQAIVSVDQEGGAVQRFDHIFSPLPSAAALAVSGPEASRKAAVICGEELAIAGINCVLAPVMDVNTNRRNPIIGTRAYGDTPEIVIENAVAATRGFIEAGVLPVGKHFPGHGDTSLDSHLDLPSLEHSMERLESLELVAFRNCLDEMPALLTAHVWVQALDKDLLPGSLSRNVTEQLLRERLGFDRVIFTDDMLMKGVTKNFDLAEAAVMAVEAGADQLLICGTSEQIEQVHKKLMESISTGRISIERIEQSLGRRAKAFEYIRECEKSLPERIAELKQRVSVDRDASLQLSYAGVTVERGKLASALESTQEIHLLIPDHPRYPLDFYKVLQQSSELRDYRFKAVRYPVNPQDEDIERLSSDMSGRAFWMFTFRAVINRAQLKLAETLAKSGKPMLLVACDLPYDLDEINGYQTAVAVRDPSEHGVESFVRHLCDDARKITPSGKGTA